MHFSLSAWLNRYTDSLHDLPRSFIRQVVFLPKGKITYFVNTVFNYPTLAECYKAAAFNGLNRLS